MPSLGFQSRYLDPETCTKSPARADDPLRKHYRELAQACTTRSRSALSLQSVSEEKPDFGIMAVTLEDLLVKPLRLSKLPSLVQLLGLFKDAGHGAHGNMKRRSRNHE